MPIDAFAPAVLIVIFLSGSLLALHRSRSGPAAPVPDAPAGGGATRITSRRARCRCTHARQDHPGCAQGDCGCAAFIYSGGLTDPPAAARAIAAAATGDRG